MSSPAGLDVWVPSSESGSMVCTVCDLLAEAPFSDGIKNVILISSQNNGAIVLTPGVYLFIYLFICPLLSTFCLCCDKKLQLYSGSAGSKTSDVKLSLAVLSADAFRLTAGCIQIAFTD